MKHGSEFPEYAEENRQIWDTNAHWWDDQIGDGNAFQEILIEPVTERLLKIRRDDCILDVACGAGRFARRMASLGANVVGVDHSAKFIERARQRGKAEGQSVEYHVMDTSNKEELLSLGLQRFNHAVCTMALMDMPCLTPLMGALTKILKPNGTFVFSVVHPCFNSASMQHFVETHEDPSGRQLILKGVKVLKYMTPEARKTEGIIGQPMPQYYFHRPLNVLLRPAHEAGFVVDALEESAFSAETTKAAGLRWMDQSEIPPVMLVRMKLSSTG